MRWRALGGREPHVDVIAEGSQAVLQMLDHWLSSIDPLISNFMSTYPHI